MDRPLHERVYAEIAGCGRCGRFELYIESSHSEHTQDYIKATCPHCGWTETRPLRPVRTAEEALAEVHAKKALAEAHAKVSAPVMDDLEALRRSAENVRLENERNDLLGDVQAKVRTELRKS